MKKARILSVISALALLASSAMVSCGKKDEGSTTTKDGKTVLKLMTFTKEVKQMCEKYFETHPDFAAKYELKVTEIPTTDGQFQPALDQALKGGGADAPDFYCAEAAFVLKYTKGTASEFAAPYEDLGIDVENKIKEADIAPYSVEIGRNPEGKVVGLGYQATGGAFIYRRSVAKEAFGTDDPAEVEKQIGAGTNSWDQFYKCAEDLKKKNIAIISGDGDLWHAVENSSDKGWIDENNALYIDPKREEFLDLSKKLKDNGYHNDTQDWQEGWIADMKGEGDKPVLGYFGPAWLINYSLKDNCGGSKIGEGTYGDWGVCQPPIGFFWGGTWVIANKASKNKEAVGKIIEWITLDTSEQGLQYMWANGTFDPSNPTKDVVASNVVMSKSDGKVDILNGQDMFPVYQEANKFAKGDNLTQFDEGINSLWRDQVRQYTGGAKSRDAAIKDFKQAVGDTFDVKVD
jgi:maltose-binding protein MalE